MGKSIGAVMRRKRAAWEKQEDRLTEDLLHRMILRDAVYDAAMAVAKLGRVGLAAYPRFPSYSTLAKEWDEAMSHLIECAERAEEVE